MNEKSDEKNDDKFIEKQINKLDNLFLKVFGCKEGEQLLDELRIYFIDMARVADPNLSANWAFYRQGQNDVVSTLIKKYNEAYEKRKNSLNDK